MKHLPQRYYRYVSPRPLVTTGWWCTAEFGRRQRSYRAPSPTQALVWMRTEVRALFHSFDPSRQQAVYDWLDYGQWEAISKLRSGETYTFSTVIAGRTVLWTAHPVGFLQQEPERCCLRQQG